jgi:ABC-type Zn uptake system ZnuABC Zn-binding protein ZnuA
MKNSFSLICLLFLFWACSNSTIRNQDVRAWQQTNDKIRVLTSVMMIEDLVRQIGGEHVATLSLN